MRTTRSVPPLRNTKNMGLSPVESPLRNQRDLDFMTDPPKHIESLGGDIRGLRALPHLLDPRQPPLEMPGEVLMGMTQVTSVDAYSGAVIRASVEQHLARSDEAVACIWQPQDETVWETVKDLLGPLPDRCSYPSDAVSPLRDPRVFLPAERVADMDHANLLARYIRVAGLSAGLNNDEAGYLATAVPAMVDNSLKYAPKSPCGVVVCGAIEGDTGDGQLVAIDLGDSVSAGSDAQAAIRACLEQSRREFGGLSHLQSLATARGLDVSISIASGTGRSRWRQRWRHTQAAFAPGWCIGISVHPPTKRPRPRVVAPRSG